MTDTTQPDDFRSQATEWVRGNRYEDFTIGRVFKHHWDRTITDADSILFTTLTLGYNPIYFNADYAQAHGHERLVVNPLLVFNTVFGLTVEDLSEGGGPFLGVDALTYPNRVYVGDTVYAESEVTAARETDSRPDYGIVTWHTVGRNQDGETVIDYTRTNLVRKRT